MKYRDYKPIMEQVFENYNRLVKIEQDDYLERLLSVMKEKGKLISFSRGESAFRDFAIEGYLRNLKNKHDEWLEILNSVKVTRDIADGFGFDNLEEQEM